MISRRISAKRINFLHRQDQWIQMKQASPDQPPRPGTGWKGFRLPPAAWHTIQMAVLGFIGICGVLRTTSRLGSARSPMAGRCTGGRRAGGRMHSNLHRRPGRLPHRDALDGDRAVAGGTARLRAGIRLTIMALILAVIAALSGWWPSPASNPAVAVTGTTGQAWCGPIVSGPAEGTALHRQRHHHRAHPGHRPSQPDWAVPVGAAHPAPELAPRCPDSDSGQRPICR